MLTDKEKAALEQLEEERQRRIVEKIEKGKAVLMPPRILGAPEPERPRAIPKDAEGREIYGGTRTQEGGVTACGCPRNDTLRMIDTLSSLRAMLVAAAMVCLRGVDNEIKAKCGASRKVCSGPRWDSFPRPQWN